MNSVARRLLIRPGALGDCILSLPALAHLRAPYTEVWAPTAVLPLIRFADSVQAIGATGLDRVGVGDLKPAPALIAKLRSFDSIVSWYGANRPEFRDVLAQLGLSCEFHPALPPADFAEHAVDFFAGQVGAPPGLIPRIPVPPVRKRNAIVIHPLSGSKRKNWPLENFRELATRLPMPVEWSAGPEEDLPEAKRFEDLFALATWIAGARLYIGNDSGITHLASAAGATVLALFGPTDPNVWGPRGENASIVRGTPLEFLSVENVAAEAIRLIDKEQERRGS